MRLADSLPQQRLAQLRRLRRRALKCEAAKPLRLMRDLRAAAKPPRLRYSQRRAKG